MKPMKESAKKKWLWISAAIVIVSVSFWHCLHDDGEVEMERSAAVGSTRRKPGGEAIVKKTETMTGMVNCPYDERTLLADSNDEAEDDELEESGAADEDALVDAFDNEVDRWMDDESEVPPTMKEIAEFKAKFKALPEDRKEECLQRALNLVSDDNIMLLAGILMDKSIDREFVELVFNDILNRDEAIKETILRIIYKDSTHVCWADTAWILDVTGALPNQGAKD